MQPPLPHNHARYDAENRLSQVDGGSTAKYGYDALSQRVQKTEGASILQYVHDLSGQVVLEMDGTGNGSPVTDYIYLAGSLVAEYKDNTTYFTHTDPLSSTRLMTKMDQSGYDYFDNLPFGELIGGGSGTTHKFTGDERDSETNLDHTWFRQYSSQFGRWTTPDPAGLMAVSLDSPQSLNRYSYVNNMPLSYFDPTGLCGDGLSDISHAECDGSYGGQGGAGGPTGGGGSWNLQCVQSFTNLGPSGGTTSCWWDWTAGSGQRASLPQRLNIDRGGGIDWAWWRTRVKEFFKLSGGPGNVPTCAEEALKQIASEFVPLRARWRLGDPGDGACCPGVGVQQDCSADDGGGGRLRRG